MKERLKIVKNEFLEFLNELMLAAPEVVKEKMTDDIKSYIEAMVGAPDEKPVLTDNGKLVLTYMRDNPMSYYKSKDIAEGLFVSSRTVSGAMGKLVKDGFVEKVAGSSPIVYILTNKGKEFKIDD